METGLMETGLKQQTESPPHAMHREPLISMETGLIMKLNSALAPQN